MYRLNLKTEPYWIDLPHEVRLLVRPLTTSVFNYAQAIATREVLKIKMRIDELSAVGQKDNTLPDFNDTVQRNDFLNTEIMKGCAISCIVDWEGIEDPKLDGSRALVTKENVLRLVDDFVMGSSFWAQLKDPFETLVDEGNVSSLDQSGTSEEEVPTAHLVETPICLAQTESM